MAQALWLTSTQSPQERKITNSQTPSRHPQIPLLRATRRIEGSELALVSRSKRSHRLPFPVMEVAGACVAIHGRGGRGSHLFMCSGLDSRCSHWDGKRSCLRLQTRRKGRALEQLRDGWVCQKTETGRKRYDVKVMGWGIGQNRARRGTGGHGGLVEVKPFSKIALTLPLGAVGGAAAGRRG